MSFLGQHGLAPRPARMRIIAYNDPEGGSDYDATTWTAPLDEKDRFHLSISQSQAGQSRVAASGLPLSTGRHRRTRAVLSHHGGQSRRAGRGRFEISNSLRRASLVTTLRVVTRLSAAPRRQLLESPPLGGIAG